MNPHDLQRFVIAPTLRYLALTPDTHNPTPASSLLLATAWHESKLIHLKQSQGPALGIFQIEPKTHQDLWQNFLNYHPRLKQRVKGLLPAHYRGSFKDGALTSCLNYATAMARLIYFRVKAPLPDAHNIPKQSTYWKTYYNTTLGCGTQEQFVAHTQRLHQQHPELFN